MSNGVRVSTTLFVIADNVRKCGHGENLAFSIESMAEKAADVEADNVKLRQWVDDLLSGMYVNCVYCGHRYPPGTPGVQSKVLYNHIKECPKHPLSKAFKELDLCYQVLDHCYTDDLPHELMVPLKELKKEREGIDG